MTNEQEKRLEDDWKSRCDWCGWPLKETVEEGCIRGNCSMRPLPQTNVTWKYKQEIRELESQLTAKVERIKDLEANYKEAVEALDVTLLRKQAANKQPPAKEEDLSVVRFQLTNVQTERDVANQEIERLNDEINLSSQNK